MSDKNLIAHLVGSIPLSNPENVFRTVSEHLEGHLSRLPDGETGKRLGWIKFLQDYLNNQHPDMETDSETPPLQWRQWDGLLLREVPRAKFKNGTDLNKVTFVTGYAEDAIKSFSIFDKLQGEGVIHEKIKFQICIPTPLAPAYNFVAPNAQDAFIPVYTKHILEELKTISEQLPKNQISIQWDVCQEVLMWENYYDFQRPDYKEEICSILGNIGDGVPEPIELGYHLCYGSPKDEHLVQPKDSTNMVEMTQGIMSSVRRPINFFHLPVPKDRDDDAYFAPLKNLDLPHDTELYLGLIHHKDPRGDIARLEMAKQYVEVNGIGSECGWGRTDPNRVPGLLKSHAKLINMSKK